ncbi:hypothetical protein MTO96_049423 [Rhipicephalus appendiculatus]
MRHPNPAPRGSRYPKPTNRSLGQPRARGTNRVNPPRTAQAGVPVTSQPAGAYQYNHNAAPGTPRAAAAHPGSVGAVGSSQEALVAGGHGDPDGPSPDDFESTMAENTTPFFEIECGCFKAWQVFIMWLAITGLIVYIASLIGFRHTLTNPKSSTLSHTHINDYAYPGDVNGTCDEYTPCRGEGQCRDGRCACLQPLFVVVEGICQKATREQFHGGHQEAG